MARRRIVLGIGGASGFQHGYKAPQLLQDIENVETHLIVSKDAEIARALETPHTKEEACKIADIVHPIGNLAASIPSGSFKTVGMLAAPCSMCILAAVIRGYSDNLLTRATDVILKERRNLMLMMRETPLSLAYLGNMCRVTEVGGIILSPVPVLCLQPQSVDNILIHSVSRALESLGLDIPNPSYRGQ